MSCEWSRGISFRDAVSGFSWEKLPTLEPLLAERNQRIALEQLKGGRQSIKTETRESLRQVCVPGSSTLSECTRQLMRDIVTIARIITDRSQ